jgi:hypothetical protein
MTVPLLFPAPEWTSERSEYITLWHGCTLLAKDSIEANGIDLTRCAPDTDFGRGFYTTTLERQAQQWAVEQQRKSLLRNPAATGNPPVVLRFRVRRYTRLPQSSPLDDGLDQLISLHFVRGDYDAVDFWSFVQHCRQSVPEKDSIGVAEVVNNHCHPRTGWYQLVSGPVTAFWQQRALIAGSDQFSFHQGGIHLIEALIQAGKGKGQDGNGDPDFYQWFLVT